MSIINGVPVENAAAKQAKNTIMTLWDFLKKKNRTKIQTKKSMYIFTKFEQKFERKLEQKIQTNIRPKIRTKIRINI